MGRLTLYFCDSATRLERQSARIGRGGGCPIVCARNSSSKSGSFVTGYYESVSRCLVSNIHGGFEGSEELTLISLLW